MQEAPCLGPTRPPRSEPNGSFLGASHSILKAVFCHEPNEDFSFPPQFPDFAASACFVPAFPRHLLLRPSEKRRSRGRLRCRRVNAFPAHSVTRPFSLPERAVRIARDQPKWEKCGLEDH